MLWEDPVALWARLKLGREEYLQRLLTTLIVGGSAPAWNSPTKPSDAGTRFLRALDALAHDEPADGLDHSDLEFVDEYLLPKVEESSPNGWPDWAVLLPDRLWVIELKTEAGSHRPGQLAYYLSLAAAAHPSRRVDLSYVTGPLDKPAPELGHRQRYSHITWDDVLPLVEQTWGQDGREEVRAYVDMVRTVVQSLLTMKPAKLRASVLDTPTAATSESAEVPAKDELLKLARATGVDGQQRAVGATDPVDLEALRDAARSQIACLSADDRTRFVLPWLWNSATAGGRALTVEGEEFGYELRFSRYQTMQVKP